VILTVATIASTAAANNSALHESYADRAAGVLLSKGFLATKCAHGVNYLRLFRPAHAGEKWETQQAVHQIFRDRTAALASAKPQTHRG